MKIWHSLEIEIARAAEQVVSGQLWLAGTTGIEISEDGADTLTFRAYFDEARDTATLKDQILASLKLAGIPDTALRSLTPLDVEDQDWLAEWKKGYGPTPIGDRLLITPSWKRDEIKTSNRIIVEIDPGMAFGTGTHETTRGCLEMLDRYWHGGSLLDAGTGTGILAIAAIKLAPGSRVTGFDIDPEAIVVADANAAINGVSDDITLEVNNLGAYEGEAYDIVMANLTADVLIPLSARFARVLKPAGLLVASGILLEQENDVVGEFTVSGFAVTERKPDGEWVTIGFQRRSGETKLAAKRPRTSRNPNEELGTHHSKTPAHEPRSGGGILARGDNPGTRRIMVTAPQGATERPFRRPLRGYHPCQR